MYYITKIILVYLTESQKLNPGNYITEYTRVYRRKEQYIKDRETGKNKSRNEKDRIELIIPGRGKWLIY
jgi:uncharacterized protein YeeX (DUF496 family)